jgi:hypothetical protein
MISAIWGFICLPSRILHSVIAFCGPVMAITAPVSPPYLAHSTTNGNIIPSVGLSFGGFGMPSEELPRTAEELKEFVRGWKTFDGKPMDGWYIDLVDFLSRDGGWERAHYEEFKIRACFLRLPYMSITDLR